MIKKSLAATAVLVIFATAATAQYKPQQARPREATMERTSASSIEKARRITKEEALKLTKRGDAVFVDVRSVKSYAAGHLPGAISIPQSQLAAKKSSIPPKKMLITYCACKKEETAAMAVVFFNNHGVTNVAALKGGYNEWVDAGLPIQR